MYPQKHIALKPDDPQPYYSIGVIDWAIAYRGNTELRSEYNRANVKKPVKDIEPLPPAVRTVYVEKYGAMVDDGITSLRKAVELKPDYEDAIRYLKLFICPNAG